MVYILYIIITYTTTVLQGWSDVITIYLEPLSAYVCPSVCSSLKYIVFQQEVLF